MASTDQAAHQGPAKWLRTRRRRVAAGVGALALIGTVMVAVTAHPSPPARAADQAAKGTTAAPSAVPVAIKPDAVATTAPTTTSTQSPIPVNAPSAAPAPRTTPSLSPPVATKPSPPVGATVTLAALPAGWLTLASAKGSAGATSKVFHLQDHNTRLRYTSSGVSLTIFVVDARRGLDATAGYAAADCAGVCSDGWMSLHNPAGDYYLLVQATGGRWAVDISEFSGSVEPGG